MLCNSDHCLNGHNEDNDKIMLDHSAFFDVKLGSTRFVAFTYFGDLPTTAFGFNNHGIAFSLNYVKNILRHGNKTKLQIFQQKSLNLFSHLKFYVKILILLITTSMEKFNILKI